MAVAKSAATKRVEAFVRSQPSQAFTVARSNQRGFATSGARIKEMFDRLIYARFRGSMMSEDRTIESVKKKINKGVESARSEVNRGSPILNFPSPSTSSIMRKQNLCRRGWQRWVCEHLRFNVAAR